MDSEVYGSVECISKSPSLFTKNMVLAIFEARILYQNSVIGTVSNRIKKKNTIITPRPKLNLQWLLALKGIFHFNFIFQNIYMRFMCHIVITFSLQILRY